MSDILEALYGTGGSEALEKAAQAKFVEKLASEYNVDLSELSAEQLEQLEQAVAADLADGNTEDPAAEDGDIEKAAAAYDAYGRVMAHGFLEELQKTAEPTDEDYIYVDEAGNEYSREEVEGTDGMAKEALALGTKISRLLHSAKTKAWPALKGHMEEGAKLTRIRRGAKFLKDSRSMKRIGARSASEDLARMGLLNVGKGALQSGAVYGVPTAAIGGTAYALGKRKKSSAMDTLANQRAQEILGLFGHEKVANDQELDSAVTIAAFQKLEAAGYPVNEMIDALKGAE